MDASLVIMAAGMGSRFGRLKQLEPIGPNQETLMEFAIADALNAGFSKVVFIIRKEIYEAFQETILPRLQYQNIPFEICFQNHDSFIPESFQIPYSRTKPWGTGHALLCAKDAVHTPCCVINADDYYGPQAYNVLYKHFCEGTTSALVAYSLGNTLSDHGHVSRGICENTNEGYLQTVTEHTQITKDTTIDLNTPVSLNFWGFQPAFFDVLEQYFHTFLNGLNSDNINSAECLLPSAVNFAIESNTMRFKTLESEDSWMGMTYEADLASVKNHLSNLAKS